MPAAPGILPFRFTLLHNGSVDNLTLRGGYSMEDLAPGCRGLSLRPATFAVAVLIAMARILPAMAQAVPNTATGPAAPATGSARSTGSDDLSKPAGNDFYRLDQHARAEVRRGVA